MFKVSFQLDDCCNNSFLHAFTTVWWILYELTLVVVGKVGSSKMQYKVLNSWVNGMWQLNPKFKLYSSSFILL